MISLCKIADSTVASMTARIGSCQSPNSSSNCCFLPIALSSVLSSTFHVSYQNTRLWLRGSRPNRLPLPQVSVTPEGNSSLSNEATPRQLVYPEYLGFAFPNICARITEWMPSAPISTSPKASRPSANCAQTPLSSCLKPTHLVLSSTTSLASAFASIASSSARCTTVACILSLAC